MDDHHRSNGIPVTRFTLQSVYAQNDDEKLEFEYESGTTSILVGHSSSSHIWWWCQISSAHTTVSCVLDISKTWSQ